MTVEFYRATRTGDTGFAQEQTRAETFALGSKERFADLLGNRQRHTGAVVANADADFCAVPVQIDFQTVGAGIGGVVEQIEQRLVKSGGGASMGTSPLPN